MIPARDEASTLPLLLADLQPTLTALASIGVSGRIVVADDHSLDDTALIARQCGAQVVAVPPLPPGWFGKPWACSSTLTALRPELDDDDVVVFLDADVRCGPDMPERLLAELGVADVVSVQPFHETASSAEQLSALPNVVSVMGIALGTNSPTTVVGPLIACRVGDYFDVGGHGSVRRSVAEDVELGRRFRSAGRTLSVTLGGDAVSYRMYPDGFRSLIDGWTKNLATGATSVPLWRTFGIGAWISAMGSIAIRGVEAIVGLIDQRDDVDHAVIALALYAAAALSLRAMLGRLGAFRPWTWLLYPIVLGGFIVLFARSVWRTVFRRSVAWKGRQLALTTTDLTATARGADEGYVS